MNEKYSKVHENISQKARKERGKKSVGISKKKRIRREMQDKKN